MRSRAPHRGSAPTHRLRPWRARLVTRRARVQWQLVLVVTAIAVLACTLISSLALLVAATELGAVRGALTSAPESETEIRGTVSRPIVPITEARETLETALSEADSIIIAGLFHPERYTAASAISPVEMAASLRRLGKEAEFIPVVDEIVAHLEPRLKKNDLVVIMSNGSFGGIHDKLMRALADNKID